MDIRVDLHESHDIVELGETQFAHLHVVEVLEYLTHLRAVFIQINVDPRDYCLELLIAFDLDISELLR